MTSFLVIEDWCTGSMSQNHVRNFYVMAFGLYFEVPVKEIEILKKKHSFGPDFGEKLGKMGFSVDEIQNLQNYL